MKRRDFIKALGLAPVAAVAPAALARQAEPLISRPVLCAGFWKTPSNLVYQDTIAKQFKPVRNPLYDGKIVHCDNNELDNSWFSGDL